ncbi:hypothetical protein PInf_002720 [Phytophthora infestans]|nr:hypothetical protein PInf_002720 [Phytophthora infestans]
MGTPKASIIQSAVVGSASADLNTESDSDMATACHQDVSYPGDAFARTVLGASMNEPRDEPLSLALLRVAFTKVSSAVAANSADQHSDATEDYDSQETLDAENGLDVDRRHDENTIYLGDKFEHGEVRSAIVGDSADTGPHEDDNYNISDVLLLRGTGAEIGVTSSATTVFDPGGIGYSLEQAEDDECSSTRGPMETLSQHYVAIAATKDEQEDAVDDTKTDIFERSGTDLELTDYAHERAFLPDLTEVEPTELDYDAPNVKSNSHTPAQSARLVAKLQKHEGIMIPSGNALPPPAYEALCDIDFQGHAPIK